MSQFGRRTLGSRPMLTVLALCGTLLTLVGGCVAPGYSPEREMLFEDQISIEPRLGIFIPSEGDYDNGVVAGARLSYEYSYGQHISMEITGTEGVEQDEAAPTISVPSELRGADHLALSESDRRSVVFSLDWDYPFSKNEKVPYLRWGIGIGLLQTLNGTNPSIRADLLGAPTSAGKVYAKDTAMFLVRPTLGLYWEPAEDLTLFVDAQYDWAESKVRISVDGDDTRTGVIDFGGINILVGLSYSF